MPQSPPKITIILTSFNNAMYLREAIDSTLAQTFTDFELIIWDDASTDSSWEIIQSYADPRIKTFRNDRQRHAIYGINKAITEVAQGTYIAIHHSDEIWVSEKLERQVEFLSLHPNIGAVFTWAQIINEINEEVPFDWFNQPMMSRFEWLRQLFIGENHLNHPSVLIRKECYDSAGLYKFWITQTGDAEMWSRVLLYSDIFVIPEKLTKHRIFSDGSNTNGFELVKSIRTENEWNIIRLNYFDLASAEEICTIFPALNRFDSPSGCNTQFLIAMACLLECNSRAAWTLGLQTLHELIISPDTAIEIYRIYNFDYKSLIELSGQFDTHSFGPSDLYAKNMAELRTEFDAQGALIERLKRTVFERDQELALRRQEIDDQVGLIERLNRAVTERDMQVTALLNSTSWRITKRFRWIGLKAYKAAQLLRSIRICRISRFVLRRLPLSMNAKNPIKDAVFRNLGFLLKDRTSYRHWQELNRLESELGIATGGIFSVSKVAIELPQRVKKILVVEATTPTPDRDAGSVRVWFTLKGMVDLGYDVTFIPYDLKPLGRYTENIRALGVRALTSSEIKTVEEFLEQYGHLIDIAFLYRVHTARLCVPSIKKYAPNAKIIFDTQDLHYLREERWAKLTGDLKGLRAAQFTKQSEYEIMRSVDMTIVVSLAEQEIVKNEDHSINLSIVPLLLDIPGCKNPFSKRNDIVFIGGFLHQPNVDAIKYFVSDIWPTVRSKLPDINLLVIGSNVPDEILTLSANDKQIKVVGFVKDLDTYFNQCRLSIAPLRYGAGIKGKIGTSASYGVPCVATTLAVEGMGLVDGVEVIVADDAVQFAEKVIDLYSNEDLWVSVSKGSLDFVQRNYSYEAGKSRLDALLRSLFSDGGDALG